MNYYDPELPGGFQDADLEMHTLTQAANRESRLRKKGICCHGSLQCPPGPPGKPTNVVTCRDCGKVFATEREAYQERQELLS